VTAHPTHVIHQLTALPKTGVRSGRDLIATNRLRTDGTRNLLTASIEAGARRIIGGSFAPLHGADRSKMPDGPERDAVDAVLSMEHQILDASRNHAIEGLVLRYGLFYSADNPATVYMLKLVRRRMLPVVRGDRSQLPCIHVDDAVSATVAALDHGGPGMAYNVVDDQAVSMTEIVQGLAERVGAPRPLTVPAWCAATHRAVYGQDYRASLPCVECRGASRPGWRPKYPTYRDGLREIGIKLRDELRPLYNGEI
jgi:nucleoside-diphosphate-sugar epimerase